MALGWDCNDGSGNSWRFRAAGSLFGGQVTVTPLNPARGGGLGLVGSYSGLVMNQNWSMNVGRTSYFCSTTDGGAGKSYSCNFVGGVLDFLPATFPVFNCVGTIFG
jgi:hypothetical protein